MSSTEHLAHVHREQATDDDNSGLNAAQYRSSGVGTESGSYIVETAAANGTLESLFTQSTGGNAAMNVLGPFAVAKYIISY